MFKRQLLLVGFSLVIVFLTTNISNAYTFNDSFNDETFTNSNWSVFLNDWTMTGKGYHGSAGPIGSDPDHPTERESAVNFSDNHRKFYNNGLMIQTLFTIDTDQTTNPRHTGEVLFSFNEYSDGSFSVDGASFIYNRWGDVYGTPTTSFNLEVGGVKVYEEGWLPDFGFASENALFDNALFGITIDIFDSTVTAELYEQLESSIRHISTLVVNNASYSESGFVGIATNSEATFQSFSVSDTSAVPIPAAAWLLGSGLIGFVGFRKKMKK